MCIMNESEKRYADTKAYIKQFYLYHILENTKLGIEISSVDDGLWDEKINDKEESLEL